MADCKPISTPMQPNTRLTCVQSPQTPEEVQFMKSVPYLAAVGALMYLATTTRHQILPTLLAILLHSTPTLVWLIGKLSSTSFTISRIQLTMASLMHLIPTLVNCSQPSLMQIMVDARILDVLLVATWLRLVLVLSPGLRRCKALLHYLQLKQSTLQL